MATLIPIAGSFVLLLTAAKLTFLPTLSLWVILSPVWLPALLWVLGAALSDITRL